MADWAAVVAAAMAEEPETVTAHTFVRAWSTASRPVLLSCDDGADWVVKGRQSGKQAVTDQILGTLGRVLGAPIPEITIVTVPQELISSEPELAHLAVGSAHGSRYEAGYSEREGLAHAIPENAAAFAHLAGFYGWGLAQDHQMIYRIAAPCLVRSVDHGHFIGGGSWNEAQLAGLSDEAELDPVVVAHSPPTAENLERVRDHLNLLNDGVIARAVSRPRIDWGITLEERIRLATLLASRRDRLRVKLEALLP